MARKAARGLRPWILGAAVFALLLLGVEAGSFAALRLLGARAAARPLPAAAMPAYRAYPWAETFWREQKRQLSLEYHPFGLWRSRPFAGETVNVDTSGTRRTAHSRCGPDDPLVWLFGGSTMWGFGSPDWETIPSHLARRFAEAGRPVCAVNYGEDSWRAAQGVVKLVLELERAPRRPDLVVFVSGCNDVLTPFFLTGRADREWDFAETKPWLDELASWRGGGFSFLRLTNTARLARRVATRLKGPAAWPRPADAEGLGREVVEDYFRHVDAVAAMARGYGFRYGFFWQPMAVAGGKTLTAEEREGVARQLGLSEERARSAAALTFPLVRARQRADVHDLSEAFDGKGESLYVDCCHFLPDGNRLVADRIYESLTREGPPTRR